MVAVATGCATDPTDGPSPSSGGKEDGSGSSFFLRFEAGDLEGEDDLYAPQSFVASDAIYAANDSFGRWSIQGRTSAYGLHNPWIGLHVPRATGDYPCSSAVAVVHSTNPTGTGPIHLWTTDDQPCTISIHLDAGTVNGTATGTLSNGTASMPFMVDFVVRDFAAE